MAKQNKAYKFRLYPTDEQALMIHKTFGCVRFVYNKMLAERKETYEGLKDDKEAFRKLGIRQAFPANALVAFMRVKKGFILSAKRSVSIQKLLYHDYSRT